MNDGLFGQGGARDAVEPYVDDAADDLENLDVDAVGVKVSAHRVDRLLGGQPAIGGDEIVGHQQDPNSGVGNKTIDERVAAHGADRLHQMCEPGAMNGVDACKQPCHVRRDLGAVGALQTANQLIDFDEDIVRRIDRLVGHRASAISARIASQARGTAAATSGLNSDPNSWASGSISTTFTDAGSVLKYVPITKVLSSAMMPVTASVTACWTAASGGR